MENRIRLDRRVAWLTMELSHNWKIRYSLTPAHKVTGYREHSIYGSPVIFVCAQPMLFSSGKALLPRKNIRGMLGNPFQNVSSRRNSSSRFGKIVETGQTMLILY